MEDAHARAEKPTLPKKPGRSQILKEQRARRRQKARSHGYRGAEILPTTLTPIVGDPLEHLETMRLAYVREIERCAELSLPPVDRATILLKLAKLTSLGKITVDVNAELSRLMVEPDLRQLTRDDLEAILADN